MAKVFLEEQYLETLGDIVIGQVVTLMFLGELMKAKVEDIQDNGLVVSILWN